MFTIFDSLPPNCTIDQSLTESILSQVTSHSPVKIESIDWSIHSISAKLLREIDCDF